jgi:putative NIF3 family GTP cyclohydrolase 1 type 2
MRVRIMLFLGLITSHFSCQDRSSETRDFHTVRINLTDQALTASEVVDRIRQQVTCDWREETVDTYKSGQVTTRVTGIATTFLATMDVLRRAQAQGLNMVVTHEPTFYNHLDNTEFFQDDPVFQAKKAFIEEHNMVVFRFHDHWHMTSPDGVHTGMVEDLGWKDYQKNPGEMIFELPKQTVGDLARALKDHYHTPAIRVVGDPDLFVTRVGMAVGAPGSRRQIQMLRRSDVEVLLAGETQEWETVEWVRDAAAQGKSKALILMGHANSEEAGMEYCAEWLRKFITEIPVTFIAAGDPFWGPE